jgi:hypothetical protein
MKRLIRLVLVAALAIGTQAAAAPGAQAKEHAPPPSSSCQLGNGITHVINVVFDNVHLTRDNPNVPSDLEQMPNLLNFIENNGVMITHNYTPLISHTADDIVTTLTGLYPDQQGLAVSNSYLVYDKTGALVPKTFPSAFQYWTDKAPTGAFNNVTSNGKNTPAPWVPFTRAGCNVGGVSTANIELENNGNLATVFGAGSPNVTDTDATADFIGIAVHCAKNNAVCSAANGGQNDVLPQEPGGYKGYKALFGHDYVVPAIGGTGPGNTTLTDLANNPITGFPGFGGISAAQSLAYTASMLEHGVPVTYSYISDAHDNHSGFGAFGPGEAGYEAQLKAYDQAFGKFFVRLAADGITPQNTLFNVTSDENDHFAGKLLPNCDGVTTPCVYNHSNGTGNIGEIATNMTDLMTTKGVTTSFDLHFDSAPAVYLKQRVPRTDDAARKFERVAATLVDPANYVTGLNTPLMQRMADPVEMQNLHMITGDPLRTPTFIYFGNPDYFFQTIGTPDFFQNSGFAWQHGDFQPEIVTSFMGLVGPGVKKLGVDDTTWMSHADTRPTIMALTRLHDDYRSEGRVLAEDLKPGALPESLTEDQATFIELAQTYSQLNAPVGQFGLDTLKISTTALASTSSGDKTYTSLEDNLMEFGEQRDDLARQMSSALNAAEFNRHPINEEQASNLIGSAQELLEEVHAAAA